LAFSKLIVCFGCGLTLFVLPERELNLLEKNCENVRFTAA
jgi:hypothetical protein